MTVYAYDITAVEQWPEDAIRWPTSIEDTHALNRAIIPAVVATGRQLPDEDSRMRWALAAPVMDVTCLTVCLAWLVWQRARASGMAFRFERQGIVRALFEGAALDADGFYGQVRDRVARTTARQEKSWLRAQAHGFLTNQRLLWPWDRPTGIFNHNTLLQGMARQDQQRRFAYLMADRVFAHHQRGALPTASSAQVDLFHGAVAALLDRILPTVVALGGGDVEPLRTALQQATVGYLATVASYDAALRQHWRSVPREVWTGTGGNILTRLVRAAVKREGGSVIGFEHGGGGHIHADLGPLHIHEFAFCDRFVVDAKAKAKVLTDGLSPAKSLDGTVPVIEATSAGKASFPFRTGQGTQPPKRVMYVTTAFVGETQYPLQPLLPDPVHADWQGRLIDGLAGQGLEVLVKQHPEGLRKGVPLKRSQAGEFLGGRFGEVMDQADAFVLDYPATSTLWEAICSEKPVVFIDHHLAHWNPEVWQDFSARCAIVPSRMDADGRPQVDFAEVAAALQTAPDDGGAFARKYLLAEQG